MYVDIDILRSYFIKDRNTETAKKVFRLKEKFVTSAATVEQLIADSKKAKKKVNVLKELKKLKIEIVPVDKGILEKAVEIMKKYNLLLYPAIHASTALKRKEKLLSFDRRFDKVPKIERVDPYTLVALSVKV